LIFSYLDPGTSFKAYLSYSNSRPCPDSKENDKEIFIGYVPKNPHSIDLACKPYGPDFVFEYPMAYVAFIADKDTNVNVYLKTKTDRN